MSTQEISRLPVAVLGAGITGLTAAWQLQHSGVPVVVLEAGSRAGGVIGTKREQGWLQEGGPNSLMESSPEVATFIAELGLTSRKIYANESAKKRFVVRGGKLVALPNSKFNFLTNHALSWQAKLGVLGEPFRRRAPADQEESMAQFVTRRLGSEFLDYIVEPFVAGIYAGNAHRLSVRQAFPRLYRLEQEHGSLILGAIKRRNLSGGPRGGLVSFPDGLEEIPRALAQSLGANLRTNNPVLAIRPTGADWEVRLKNTTDWIPEKFSAVICALPPDALAGLTIETVPAAQRLRELCEIEQPSVASVFMGFQRQNVEHPLDGFGFLAPQVEKRRILGTLFSSTLFPDRAPSNHIALTTFVGGTRQPELTRLNDDALADLVRDELAQLLDARGDPAFVRVQRWPHAIPQYNLGFQRFKDIYTAIESAAPGLFIGGNGRDGISLPNCIESGKRLAAAVQNVNKPK